MRTFCRILLRGHLGRDPDERLLPTGAWVHSFNLAVNEDVFQQVGDSFVPAGSRVTWYRISVFDPRAFPTVRALHKGDFVEVEGTLNTGELRYLLNDFNMVPVLASRLSLPQADSTGSDEFPEPVDGDDFGFDDDDEDWSSRYEADDDEEFRRSLSEDDEEVEDEDYEDEEDSDEDELDDEDEDAEDDEGEEYEEEEDEEDDYEEDDDDDDDGEYALLIEELDDDSECYASASESGWFYGEDD